LTERVATGWGVKILTSLAEVEGRDALRYNSCNRVSILKWTDAVQNVFSFKSSSKY
jgi:hypothetical protein